tara:strand:+ start:544 stop:1305 length:762 start_codon:yes stop_codon:yes gene_type:complete
MKNLFEFILISTLRVNDFINSSISNVRIKLTQYQLHIFYMLIALLLCIGLVTMLLSNSNIIWIIIYSVILFINLLFVSAAIYAFEKNIKILKIDGKWGAHKITEAQTVLNSINPEEKIDVQSNNGFKKIEKEKIIELIKEKKWFRSDNLDVDLNNLFDLNFYKIDKLSIHAVFSQPIDTGRILFQLFDLKIFTEKQVKEIYRADIIKIRNNKLKGNYNDHKSKLITNNGLFGCDEINIHDDLNKLSSVTKSYK